MKILILHNHYQHRGGEDAVFEAEVALLRQHGHPVETLTISNDIIQSATQKLDTAWRMFYNPAFARRLETALVQRRPDIIHVHNFFPLASPAVFQVTNRHHIPVVLTLHNFRLLCANAMLLLDGKNCEKCISQPFPLAGIKHRCYRNSTLQSAALGTMTGIHHLAGTWRQKVNHYIALNQFARNKFLNSHLGLNANQISVKPNFLFDPAVGNIQDKENFLLYVGRLSEEKGIDVLLQAFGKTGIPLRIIGDGPLKAQVEEAANEYAHITYLGYQDKPEVIHQLRQARALILPSICYENCPMSVIEALATGTPVIVSNNGGLSEFVHDGYNGLLTSPGNADSLLEKVKLLSGDDEAFKTLCLNARESYLRHYTPEVNYRMLMNIYDSAIQEHKDRPR